ncbi:hypothetical protein B0T18DRAFT_485483 [Schizothecium vesticola]|uniref:Uncharacterized protein n=1 Tax=Schizothecium vesticola TaxID=314040 RepID=A0AA40F479_9PEZI|nr:hypothetical protein B0T18DRAFT_485483 [Schizothecium vesticola]
MLPCSIPGPMRRSADITNASSGTFRFDPYRITRSGSPSLPRNNNMTGDEVLSQAMNDLNYLAIAQPDLPEYGARMHFLPAFVLLPHRAQELFMAEYSAGRETERKQWTVAVAVAVPIVLFILGPACFWLGKRPHNVLGVYVASCYGELYDLDEELLHRVLHLTTGCSSGWMRFSI